MGEFFAGLETDHETDHETEENDGNKPITDHNTMKNIEPDQNFDTMENIELLPQDDRAILESQGDNGNNKIEAGHVQNGDSTGTIETNDRFDRPGNPPGFPVPTN